MKHPAGPLLAAAVLLGIACLARRSFDVVEVRGRSMAPTLLPGDRLLVARVTMPRRGEVVLAADPRDGRRELIKRVAAIGPGGVELRGDDGGASTDGRTFGRVPVEAVRWRAVLRYWPPGRATADLRLSRA
jgi:nickel-type superoxide dismutase maturation protease